MGGWSELGVVAVSVCCCLIVSVGCSLEILSSSYYYLLDLRATSWPWYGTIGPVLAHAVRSGLDWGGW